jgi:DNA-binding MarR family transcriptional regulator
MVKIDEWFEEVHHQENEQMMNDLSTSIKETVKKNLVDQLFGEHSEFLSYSEISKAFAECVTKTAYRIIDESTLYFNSNGGLTFCNLDTPSINKIYDIKEILKEDLQDGDSLHLLRKTLCDLIQIIDNNNS